MLFKNKLLASFQEFRISHKDDRKFSSGASRTDGSSIAGQTFERTYDSKTDLIASTYNEKFVHPTESIKDRISIAK